jgi:hypothetical protein
VVGVDETSVIVQGSHSGGCLDEGEGPQRQRRDVGDRQLTVSGVVEEGAADRGPLGAGGGAFGLA